jgi:hypothetical protein
VKLDRGVYSAEKVASLTEYEKARKVEVFASPEMVSETSRVVVPEVFGAPQEAVQMDCGQSRRHSM